MTTRAHSYEPHRGPITLATLHDLFAHHRNQFGGWHMVENDPTDPPADPPADPQDPPSDPPADPEKKFTQADLDRILGEKLGKEKTKYEAQLKELQESAGKTELEKVTAERDRYKTQAESGTKTAGERLVQAEAKVAAVTLKARPDRVAQVIKQADLAGAVGDDGEVDDAKVQAAIEKVLADFPEWKATPGKSGNEVGGNDPDGKPTFTRQQIKDMSPEERARRVDELNAAMAEGRITG